MIDLGPPILRHRILGRADYRGWALLVDTYMGEGLVKRWTMGHNLVACVAVWLWLALRLRRTWDGAPVLRAEVVFIDRRGW